MSRRLQLLTLDCRREPKVHQKEFLRQVQHLASLLDARALSATSSSLSSSAAVAAGKSSGADFGTANGNKQLSVGSGGTGDSGSSSAANLHGLLQFVGALAATYKDELRPIAEKLRDLLREHAANLSMNERQWVLRTVRSFSRHGVLDRLEVLKLCFELFVVPDREFRTALRAHIVADVRRTNRRGAVDKALNRATQAHLFQLVASPSPVMALKSLDVVTELYWKRAWNDARTVNVIADACLSDHAKVSARAIRFFLSNSGGGGNEGSDDDDDDDEMLEGGRSAGGGRVARLDQKLRELKQKARAGRVSRKAKAQEKRLLSSLQKAQSLRRRLVEGAAAASTKAAVDDDGDGDGNGGTGTSQRANDAALVNFPAIQLLHSPHDFAEKLLRRSRRTTGRFEVRVMTFNLISRLIGAHELLLYDFYPLLQKYLQPHQAHVTSLLAIFAQSCHSLVDPDVLHPLIRTLADQFIADRSRPEVIAVGLNAVREVCRRSPLAMTEDMLHDLAEYCKHRDRAVVAAARSLVNLFRVLDPELLPKKMRGMPATGTHQQAPGDQLGPGEEANRSHVYGQSEAPDRIPGLEYVDEGDQSGDSDGTGELNDADNDEFADRLYVVDQFHDHPDESESTSTSVSDDSDGNSDADASAEAAPEDEDGDNSCCRSRPFDWRSSRSGTSVASRLPAAAAPAAAAAAVANTELKSDLPVEAQRFLNQEEFARLRETRERLAAPPSSVGQKRSAASLAEAARATHESAVGAVVNPTDLEVDIKRRKTKDERLASVLAGREDRVAFGSAKNRREKHGGISNKQKEKLKNFVLRRNSRARRDAEKNAKAHDSGGKAKKAFGKRVQGTKGRKRGLAAAVAAAASGSKNSKRRGR